LKVWDYLTKAGWEYSKGGELANFAYFPSCLTELGFETGVIKRTGKRGQHFFLDGDLAIFHGSDEDIDRGVHYRVEPSSAMLKAQKKKFKITDDLDDVAAVSPSSKNRSLFVTYLRRQSASEGQIDRSGTNVNDSSSSTEDRDLTKLLDEDPGLNVCDSDNNSLKDYFDDDLDGALSDGHGPMVPHFDDDMADDVAMDRTLGGVLEENIVDPREAARRVVVPCRKRIAVHQLDSTTGDILHTHASIFSAAASAGASRPGIKKCCSGEQDTAGGFGWKRADTTNDVAGSFEAAQKGKGPCEAVRGVGGHKQCVPVHQLDSTTRAILNTHVSMQSAAASVGINKGDISKCCSGQQDTAGGFGWKRANATNDVSSSLEAAQGGNNMAGAGVQRNQSSSSAEQSVKKAQKELKTFRALNQLTDTPGYAASSKAPGKALAPPTTADEKLTGPGADIAFELCPTWNPLHKKLMVEPPKFTVFEMKQRLVKGEVKLKNVPVKDVIIRHKGAA
jgi:hypothetical protein